MTIQTATATYNSCFTLFEGNGGHREGESDSWQFRADGAADGLIHEDTISITDTTALNTLAARELAMAATGNCVWTYADLTQHVVVPTRYEIYIGYSVCNANARPGEPRRIRDERVTVLDVAAVSTSDAFDAKTGTPVVTMKLDGVEHAAVGTKDAFGTDDVAALVAQLLAIAAPGQAIDAIGFETVSG